MMTVIAGTPDTTIYTNVKAMMKGFERIYGYQADKLFRGYAIFLRGEVTVLLSDEIDTRIDAGAMINNLKIFIFRFLATFNGL